MRWTWGTLLLLNASCRDDASTSDAGPDSGEVLARDACGPDCGEGCDPADDDGDGHDAVACGGDDCDDGDPAVHPGAIDPPRSDEWAYERIGNVGVRDLEDTGRTAHLPALTVEPSGIAHVVWVDADAGAVRYATNRSGRWEDETVSTEVLAGSNTSIGIAAGGTAHVTYLAHEGGDDALLLASRADGTWTSERVGEAGGFLSVTAALHVDGDVLHVISPAPLGLAHATRIGGRWSVETIGDDAYQVHHGGIAMDSRGALHVAYWGAGFDAVYATNATGAWVLEILDDGIDAGMFSNVSVDDRDRPHITFRSTSGSDLRYATLLDGSWTVEDFASFDPFGLGDEPSLAVAAGAAIHVFYTTRGVGERFATALGHLANEGGEWVVDEAAAARLNARTPSVDVDAHGGIHVIYWDAAEGTLWYGRRTPPGFDEDCDGTLDG